MPWEIIFILTIFRPADDYESFYTQVEHNVIISFGLLESCKKLENNHKKHTPKKKKKKKKTVFNMYKNQFSLIKGLPLQETSAPMT